MTTRQQCGTTRRREQVRLHPVLNGIDFLEVADASQRVLHLELIKPLAVAPEVEQVRIDGGDVVREIRVTAVALSSPTQLRITVDRAGDFSWYTLRLVRAAFADEAPADFDPRLASVDFSFKAGCPTPFDCREDDACGDPPPPAPRIDYLARDFTSFRQLMLDRMRVLAPEWQETSPADVMHALVELKAYVADYQAYQQDAVATEAYLHTARQRISVTRHAALLGYAVHEGASARAWLQVVVDPGAGGAPIALAARTRAFTSVPDTAERIADAVEERRALTHRPEVFETIESATLHAGHDLLFFHTWAEAGCCLPRGSTSATLAGDLALRPGMVLVLEEVRGPETGEPADADRAHRQAVTLIAVSHGTDPLVDPPLAVTEITWHPDDALRFALCLSLREDDANASAPMFADPWTSLAIPRDVVSVARGNIVLADHGRLVPDGAGEVLAEVPGPRVLAGTPFTFTDGTPVAPRYTPTLADAPLARVVTPTPDFELALTPTIAAELTALQVPRILRLRIEARHVLGAPIELLDAGSSWFARSGALVFALEPGSDGVLRAWLRGAAADRERVDPADALPDIRLVDDDGVPWRFERTLLAVAPDAPAFTAETEHDGSVRLRFPRGDDGATPLRAGMRFTAQYRVGGGVQGNVGVESIRHLVSGDVAIMRVRNPLPGRGGAAPEPVRVVRERAPYAFRTQERAVTEQDYADVARRHPGVQRAVATFRWTGSWYTVFVNVDPVGGGAVTPLLESELRALYERYRMAGTDIEIEGPTWVALAIEMDVCVRRDALRSTVERAIRRRLSAVDYGDGTRGLFHPDEISFGDAVHLSRIVAAAQAVPGVDSIVVTRFGRLDLASASGLATGTLSLGRLEIARLESDRNHPDRGRLVLRMLGGR